MGVQPELEYLRNLVEKYGHYLRQYFGFTLKEMAQQIGMSNPMFLMVLHGHSKLPKRFEQKFIEVFKAMDIENKTRDFKESSEQLINRTLRKKLLDSKAVLLYTLTMLICREYIRRLPADSWLRLKNFIAGFDFYSSPAFLLVKENLGKSFAKAISFYEVAFLL